MRDQPLRYSIAILLVLTPSSLCEAQVVLDRLSPPRQRVHDYIVLEGTGFGTAQGTSRVLFTDGMTTIEAGKAYVWRDNYIRIRVPVGERIAGVNTAIPKTPLLAYVRTPEGASNTLPFQVITAAPSTLEFRQLTRIAPDNTDLSTVLGSPNLNMARTKDAEIGDVNGDGFPDLLDNNSNNVQNRTHAALRLNNRDKTFTTIAWEPLSSGESGSFAVNVPPGGIFMENFTTYDADFADLNNDRLPDLIQVAATAGGAAMDAAEIRLLMNNAGGVPGRFSEESAARLPSSAVGTVGCPDDVDHGDINNDGNIDFLLTMRTAAPLCFEREASNTRVFVNDDSDVGTFEPPIVLSAPALISTHDAFFIDANDDGFEDILMCNEWMTLPSGEAGAEAQLFLHNGNAAAPAFNPDDSFGMAAASGAPADFNGDGLQDFVIGRSRVSVFINDPDSPGDFSETALLSRPGDLFYDFEIGDVDLDGTADIVGARLRPQDANTVVIWLNNGDGTFREITAPRTGDVLPEHGPYERLSAELIDFDLDGDLDLYVSGADGQDVGPDLGLGSSTIGRAPNQFFENLLVGFDIISPTRSRPAHAGSSAGGRKILVRLASSAALSGLGPADFTISVEGTALAPAATITGAAIGAEHWLLVQMPARPNGSYDLSVALASDPAVNDTEVDALLYDDDRLFDRALAIDRTNSMIVDPITDDWDWEKMLAARAAANFFVDLSENGDRIGVTSFKRDSDDGDGLVAQDELARSDFRMVPAHVGSTDNRVAARGSVGRLEPDGEDFAEETSIGAGLLEAFRMLNDPAQGDPDHDWRIVLISDGVENYAPFWDDSEEGEPLKPVLQAADPPVSVHTVAIGRDANMRVLEDIASSTGGQFFNLYTGEASYGLMSRLASIYKYIDEEIRDEQRFFYREGLPPEIPVGSVIRSEELSARNLVMVDSFRVPVGFESVSVGFHWTARRALTVGLLDPAGRTIRHAPPISSLYEDPMHQVYRIPDPTPGWYYYVMARNTSEDFEFFVTASGITDLVAKGRAGAVREASPGFYEVPIRTIIGDFEPVRFARVHGEVVLPDRSRVPIVLEDDGANFDGASNDAIYGKSFRHSQPGAYLVELVAEGISNRNQPFKRYLYFSFVFPGGDEGRDTPDLPPDLRVDPQKPRLLFGLEVGSSHPLRTLDARADANIHLRLQTGFRLTSHLRLVAMAGLSQFTEETATAADNIYWLNYSGNLQALVPLPNGLRLYLQAGGGLYVPKTGFNEGGFNVGLGGQIPVSRPFLVQFGGDYHRTLGDLPIEFLTAQIGVLFGLW